MIQVSELSYATEEGLRVLDDVHLHVDQGQFVYLVGPASSGKSLLLALLGAFVPPQRGQILVHGRNVARLSRDRALELQRRIGVLPQGFTPLARTVMGNVVFKLRAMGNSGEEAEEKALSALETVGLIRERATDALDLPPVERLRLGLALALCNAPLLVLLDEPYGELDEDEDEAVGAVLAKIRDGRTTIVAATRGPLPKSARGERTLSMMDGRVTAA
ncbi:MAG: ATP-binding cassette domain-containing protein [Candidatus Bipolaricaulota bacterium]